MAYQPILVSTHMKSKEKCQFPPTFYTYFILPGVVRGEQLQGAGVYCRCLVGSWGKVWIIYQFIPGPDLLYERQIRKIIFVRSKGAGKANPAITVMCLSNVFIWSRVYKYLFFRFNNWNLASFFLLLSLRFSNSQIALAWWNIVAHAVNSYAVKHLWKFVQPHWLHGNKCTDWGHIATCLLIHKLSKTRMYGYGLRMTMIITCTVNCQHCVFDLLPSERKCLHCTLQWKLCIRAIKLSSPTHPERASGFWEMGFLGVHLVLWNVTVRRSDCILLCQQATTGKCSAVTNSNQNACFLITWITRRSYKIH